MKINPNYSALQACRKSMGDAPAEKQGLIARWESKGGAHMAELHKAKGSGYYYRCNGGGGYLGNDLTETQAVAVMEQRCAIGAGYFQPDKNKSAMRRIV